MEHCIAEFHNPFAFGRSNYYFSCTSPDRILWDRHRVEYQLTRVN